MSDARRLEGWEWEVVRKMVYFILLDLDGKIQLPRWQSPPATMRELQTYVQGQTFEIDLQRTLEITSDALKSVAQQLEAVHRLAAAVRVPSPSSEKVAALTRDLEAVHRDLQNDQRFKAGVLFAGEVAKIRK